MFNTSYFDRLNNFDNKGGNSEKHKQTRYFSFKGSASIYIVEVEVYDYDVYILKFYLKAHSNSENKFNLLSEDNDAQGVIGTILQIAVDILQNENSNASFGFIGSHRVGESKENTQRFRIYREIMKNYFGEISWNHFELENASAYLMLNSVHEQSSEIAQSITEMFAQIYEEFSSDSIVQIIE